MLNSKVLTVAFGFIFLGLNVFCIFPLNQGRPESVYAEEGYDQLFDRAIELVSQGDITKAIEFFEKASVADPNRIDPLLNMGIFYGKQNQLTQARQTLRTAQPRFPEDPRPYFYLAMIEYGAGEIRVAIQYYNEAAIRGLQPSQETVPFSEMLGRLAGRQFTVEYPSLHDSKPVPTLVIGNTMADENLCRDILSGLEKQEGINGRQQTVQKAQVELIRVKDNWEIIQERWVVSGEKGSKEYFVTMDFTPPPGFPMKVMIMLSEREDEWGHTFDN